MAGHDLHMRSAIDGKRRLVPKCLAALLDVTERQSPVGADCSAIPVQ